MAVAALAAIFNLSILATPVIGAVVNKEMLDAMGIESLQLTHSDQFEQELDNWVIEKAEESLVEIRNNRLAIDDADGSTVWFREKLSEPVMIEFEAIMVDEGGPNDRGSDLNFFWMAIDPDNKDFFAESKNRAGNMRKYDNMRLYYVGYGANDNTTTRFRRYPGDGTRPLLPELDLKDSQYMNKANQPVTMRIINIGDRIQLWRDDIKVYDFEDETPFTDGWFGFRTWKSHYQVGEFNVYQIDPESP